MFKTFSVLLVAVFLSSSASKFMFMEKHRGALESYVMTGHGKGWTRCDIITDSSWNPVFQEGDTRFVMEVDQFKNFDISATFSSSHCVLMSYYVLLYPAMSHCVLMPYIVTLCPTLLA